MKKIIKSIIIWTIICLIIGYGVGVGIAYSQAEGWDMGLLADRFAWIGLAVGAAAGFCLGIYFRPKKSSSTSSNKGKTAGGQEFALHYDSGFMSHAQILADKFLINQTWSSLPSLRNTGMILRNEKVGSKYEITMKDEMHALVIGTTGTGKTTMLIDPAVRIFAHTAEKPSLVLADPKGELYAKHARALIEEGYDVQIYDLDDPYSSSRWNPMERAFLIYNKALNLAKEAKKYSGCTPAQAGKESLYGVEYGDSWFEFNGVAYPNEEELNREITAAKQRMVNEAMFDLRGIAASVCPVTTGSNDTIWEQGAQDFLYGIMLAMLEDSVDPRLGENKLKKEQFNFYNLYKIANKRDNDPDNPFNSVRRYCSGRPKTSSVTGLTSPVIDSAASTTKSYLSVLAGKISQLMQDMGICYATSGTDIDFNKFVEKPTAFFIKIPDHKKERHPLATICISQLYRTLVDIANKFPRQKLPRHVYFLLDEFGNLPVIQDFATMVTVSRSRNIFFEIVVQSFTQLDTKYGKDTAETIKGNFNIQIFLGSEDTATREAFSKSCGNVQLISKEEQVTKNEGKDSSSKSTSTQTQKSVVPLVDPYELSRLPFGEAIIKVFRYNPIRCKLAQFHQTPQMTQYPPLIIPKSSKYLDEASVFYDIDRRNQVVLGRPSFF